MTLLEHISECVDGALDIPMWGTPPAFPWDELTESAQNLFEFDSLSIVPQDGDWKEGKSMLAGLGKNPISLSLTLAPLSAPVYFVMGTSDIATLSAWVLKKKAKEGGFSDASLQKGFFRYITLEMLSIIDDLRPFGSLTPQMMSVDLDPTTAYCIDIAIKKGRKTIWGRLLLPEQFRQGFKEHFKAENVPLTLENIPNISVRSHISAGETTLTLNEWKGIKEGDFLFLDRSFFKPKTGKGTCLLTCQGKPLFHVKLKSDHIKILDYAHYQEVAMLDDDEAMDMDMDLPPAPDEEMALDKEATPIEDTEEEATDVPVESAPLEPLMLAEVVPLEIKVEIAHINISLKELMQLEPGNQLDLSVSPSLDVDLVVEGKRIGRGSLLQMGDSVGVKISEIGT